MRVESSAIRPRPRSSRSSTPIGVLPPSEALPAIAVCVLDASGAVLYEMRSGVTEKFEVELPPHAASIAFLPASTDVA